MPVGQDQDPPQDINVFLNGDSGLGSLTGISFEIEFSGTSGNISGTIFQSTGQFCNGGTCSSGVMGADLIVRSGTDDDSFWYHDFHILFTSDLDTSIAPFNITEIAFGGAADDVAIGTWPMPEPAVLALMGIGLAGIGQARRRAVCR